MLYVSAVIHYVITDYSVGYQLLLAATSLNTHTHTHTHTQSFYCSSGFCPGLPRWTGTRKVKPGRVKPTWIYWSKR